MSSLEAEMRRGARLVEAVFDLPAETFLDSRKGRPAVVQARQVLIYLLTTEGGFEQKEVADGIGRHHSTVAHAVQKVEALREEAEFDEACQKLGEMYRALRVAAELIPATMREVPP